jgi:MFS family permease
MTSDATTAPGSGVDPTTGRPTSLLPGRHLFRISLYWLGLTSIFAGLGILLSGRLEFEGLISDPAEAGKTLLLLTICGTFIAVVVQPTIGTISDYTSTRWGRRKPYIFIGTILDVLFLVGIAFSQDLLSIAAFIALLQLSSNFAQGPFQGYVPDLVPARQVSTASALVGVMQVLGNVSGFIVASLAVAWGRYELGLLALGAVELTTMLSVVIRVDDPRQPRQRAGRSWPSIASEAWGLDILRERSFMWLLGSRLAILTGSAILVNLGLFYVARSLGYDQTQTGFALIAVVAVVALGTMLAVAPAARLSDRVGRKKVIYTSCVFGVTGLSLLALAPAVSPAHMMTTTVSGDSSAILGAFVEDPRFWVALLGVFSCGLSTGTFIAVDWALITDIIPKASSGRYMGLSNVATASSGVLAIALGGMTMDVVGGAAGPVAALWLGVVLICTGAILLRPVDETRREDEPLAAASLQPAVG